MNASGARVGATSVAWRLREWPARLFDLAVVGALLLVGGAIVAGSTQEGPHFGIARVPWYILVGVALGALLVRRRHPLFTLAVILVAAVAEGLLGSPIVAQPMMLVAVYTIASRLPWRVSLPLSAVAGVVFIAAFAISRGAITFAQVVTGLVPVGGAYVVGIYVGTRTAYIESLHASAAQQARQRDLLEQRAVADERVRIARELHDVVAHHLSLITVQATALQTQLDPSSAAYGTADSMARTGRQAMDEMRRMLGVLRLESNDAPGHAPQPGIGDIAALADQARLGGLVVEVALTGEQRAVPPGIDLSVYRIVQEALTNVMRHAAGARCRVSLDFARDHLDITVSDDGGAVVTPAATDPAGHAANGTGQGIVGMRERTALFGGHIEVGERPGGGFGVAVTLPLPPTQHSAGAPR